MKTPWPWIALAAAAIVFAAYQTGRLSERAAVTSTPAKSDTAAEPSETTDGSQLSSGVSPNSSSSPVSSSASPINYSGRRSDSPFVTDQFEPRRSPWSVRLQFGSTEESQNPGAVETVRLVVVKDGREVETAIAESGGELNANFFSKGPLSLRVECLSDWTLEVRP